MKPDKVASVMQGLFKKFKLTSIVSTSNMHLFDAEGKIKKYDTPEQSITFAMHNCFESQYYVMFFVLTFFVSLCSS